MASIEFLLGLRSRQSSKVLDSAAGSPERARKTPSAPERTVVRSSSFPTKSDPGRNLRVAVRARNSMELQRTPEETNSHAHEDSTTRHAPSMRRAITSGEKNYVKLSDFTVEGELGVGSFGQVFSAKWNGSGRMVAIKALKPKEDFRNAVPSDELSNFYLKIQGSFKAEIKFLEVAGSHPNIISCFGKSKDYKMVVVERACCDLFQLIKVANKQLPLDICHTVASGLLAGVAHLHNHGIVHQDLKSSNILLDEHGRPKICDFGLAISLRQGQDTQVNTELVTLWYRAPELLLGADRYSNQIDNWAVGCIILEMIVGRVAFPGSPASTCSCPNRRHTNFNSDQLARIFKTVGTPELDTRKLHCATHVATWPTFPSRLETVVQDGIRRRAPLPLRPVGSKAGEMGSDRKGVDLYNIGAWTAVVEDLLHCDPDQRITCSEALQYPFFRATQAKERASSPPTGNILTPRPQIGGFAPFSRVTSALSRVTSPSQPKMRPGTGCLKGSERESAVPTPRNAEELLKHLTEDKMKKSSSKEFKIGDDILKLPAIPAFTDVPALEIGDMMTGLGI